MASFGIAATLLTVTGIGLTGHGQLTTSRAWMCYGGSPQHQAIANVAASPVQRILWSAPLDDDRAYYGGGVLIHYASPVITSTNTVVQSYRYSSSLNGQVNRDNWRVIGRNGKNGLQRWFMNTDYSAPAVYPSDWTSVYPLCLAGNNEVVAAAGGGTVLVRVNGDMGNSPVTRVCFYSKLANYTDNPSQFSNIKICTPLTGDSSGNVWFGYGVFGTVPDSVASALGTGGVARISTDGSVAFQSVENMGVDSSQIRPALNAAPALNLNGSSVYIPLVDSSLSNCFLAKLDSSTLSLQASVHLVDPSVGQGALLINESSAAPMVGPDGHVFMGVFGYFWRESHGWMLQFDGDLNQTNSTGKRLPVGSFGWDDTPSVVPSNIVPSYTGRSSYLILSKYNNYAIDTGDGVNKVAVLDPSANDKTTDRQSGIPVMNEVITVVGPTPDPDSNNPNATREWCINSAAIDVKGKAAIINSEDGHAYRWSFVDNKLTQGTNLQPATGEAYTSTAIGPDGTCYAVNNSILFAIGGAASFSISSVSVYQGAGGSGSSAALLATDGVNYNVQSKSYSGVGNAAALEVVSTAPFAPSQVVPPLYITVAGTAPTTATLQVFVKNVKTGKFDMMQSVPFKSLTTISIAEDLVSTYMSATGTVTVVARALSPQRQLPFQAKFDQITVSGVQTQ